MGLKLKYPLVLLLFVFISACQESYSPKPRGYFRIGLPEKEYLTFDTAFPYSFEYPAYASIVADQDPGSEPYWINVRFPGFNGTLHMSYKAVDGNLAEYIDDSRTFVLKHIPKADAINDSLVFRPEAKVYGMVYDIEGNAAASPCQFFVTDSTTHFLRGALYFDFQPNNDSLAPVIGFIREDILHLLTTLNWK